MIRWCRSLENSTQPATYPLEIIQSESQNIHDTDRSLILSSRYLHELSNLILQHTEPLQYTWKKRDFMGSSGATVWYSSSSQMPIYTPPAVKEKPQLVTIYIHQYQGDQGPIKDAWVLMESEIPDILQWFKISNKVATKTPIRHLREDRWLIFRSDGEPSWVKRSSLSKYGIQAY